jgi:hypothetical protein
MDADLDMANRTSQAPHINLKHKDVTDKILVELKATSRIIGEHEAQLLNYLRATPYEVGLLLNFGPKPDFRRKVFDNERKTITWM